MVSSQFNCIFRARAVWPTVNQCEIPGAKGQTLLRDCKKGGFSGSQRLAASAPPGIEMPNSGGASACETLTSIRLVPGQYVHLSLMRPIFRPGGFSVLGLIGKFQGRKMRQVPATRIRAIHGHGICQRQSAQQASRNQGLEIRDSQRPPLPGFFAGWVHGCCPCLSADSAASISAKVGANQRWA